MHYKKLPEMTIKNPLTNPVILTALNKFLFFLKFSVITLLIVVFTLGVYYVNVMRIDSVMIEQKLKIETEKATELKSGVVLDTTAMIIYEEGHTSILVAKKYAEWIYDASVIYGVDPLLILSVMSVESNFNYLAVSNGGAVGLLQVVSKWHKDKTTKGALFDPKNNIMVGTQILKEYSDRSDNVISMLLMYNGSLGKAPVYAKKVLSKKIYYESKIMKAIAST